MKKNTQLHLVLETSLWENLRFEAGQKGVSISQLCRQKLKSHDKLDRILNLLERNLPSVELENRKIYKDQVSSYSES